MLIILGRDSVVDIATHYRLDGAGIISQWRRDFSHPFGPFWDPPSLQYYGYRVFLKGNAARAWRQPQPHLPPRLRKE